MQPIGTIWSKFPRVVRDLALACGKQARIELEGQETELDKTIIEAIRDPLTHLVRNAIDHGIEPAAERAARGKPRASATVAQRASQPRALCLRRIWGRSRSTGSKPGGRHGTTCRP